MEAVLGNWNALDVMAAAVVVFSVVTAFIKGFSREMIALTAVVGGLFLAFAFYPQGAALLESHFDLRPMLAPFLGFLLLFVAVMAAGAVLTYWVDRMLRELRLKTFDRFLGAGFGLARGALICMVIFLAFTAFPVRRDLLAQSRTAEFFVTGARALIVLAPAELNEKFQETYRWLYQIWLEDTAQIDALRQTDVEGAPRRGD